MPSCRKLLRHAARRDDSRALLSDGSRMPMRTAMMPMTTSNSTSVKPGVKPGVKPAVKPRRVFEPFMTRFLLHRLLIARRQRQVIDRLKIPEALVLPCRCIARLDGQALGDLAMLLRIDLFCQR